jgi:uncharacterized membrane protein
MYVCKAHIVLLTLLVLLLLLRLLHPLILDTAKNIIIKVMQCYACAPGNRQGCNSCG